jgi:hypothetical protein
VEPSSVSALAGSVSASIGMVSAVIAAVSAWNSRRSAQASRDALQDTRVQRTVDNARTELRLLVDIADVVEELTTALGHTQRDPSRVTAARARLRRVLIVAGYESGRAQGLLRADRPPSAAETAALDEELVAASARWHAVLQKAADTQRALHAS